MQLGFYISCLMQWPSQMYAVYLRVQMLFWSVVCVKLVCMMNGCLVQIIWTISIFLGTTLNIHCHLCVCICVCFLTRCWYTTMPLLSKSSSSIAYYHTTHAICFYVMEYLIYISQSVPYTIRAQWDIPQCNTFSFHYLPFPQSQHMNAHLSWPHFSKLW